MKPTVSIIIPVYNVEKYLTKCLDSVLSQTWGDYEVIIVDDGSTDSSPQICDEYEKKDERIVVVHQENKGISGARNIGIQKARGEWITFLDSDDWWEAEYLESMKLKNVELCVCGYNVLYEESQKDFACNLEQADLTILNYISHIEEYFGTVFNYVWGKMYQKNIIQQSGLFIEDVALGEDLLFNIEYYKKCKTVRVVEKSLVNYRQVDNSLSHRYHEKMFEYYELGYASYINLLKEYGIYNGSNEKRLLKKYWGNFAESLLGLSRSQKKISEKKRIIMQKQKSSLYKECVTLYRNGEMQIKSRMQKVCMRLIMNNHYYLWLWSVMLYDMKNCGGLSCKK